MMMMMMMMNFPHRNLSRAFSIKTLDSLAVVVGGSKGIGLEISRKLLKQGYRVSIVSKSKSCFQAVESLSKELQKSSRDIQPFQCNVSVYSQVRTLLNNINSSMGSIEILINCSGITHNSLLLQQNETDFIDTFETNVFSNAYLVKLVSKNMISSRRGQIILIGSLAGWYGGVGQVAYSASKSSLFGFVNSVSQELGSYGISTNLILPGFVESEMTKDLPEKIKARFLASTDNGRFSTTEDIAKLVDYTLKRPDWNGKFLSINGGDPQFVLLNFEPIPLYK